MLQAYAKFRETIMSAEYQVSEMERLNAFREEFNNRQKDISIGIHISRILSEMRFRARINHRATDFSVIHRGFKLTDNLNMVVFELLRYSENARQRCFQVYAYWDRTQTSDVYLKVFRINGTQDNTTIEFEFEITLQGMAALMSVNRDNTSQSAAEAARSDIHNTFAKYDIDVGAALVTAN